MLFVGRRFRFKSIHPVYVGFITLVFRGLKRHWLLLNLHSLFNFNTLFQSPVYLVFIMLRLDYSIKNEIDKHRRIGVYFHIVYLYAVQAYVTRRFYDFVSIRQAYYAMRGGGLTCSKSTLRANSL